MAIVIRYAGEGLIRLICAVDPYQDIRSLSSAKLNVRDILCLIVCLIDDEVE